MVTAARLVPAPSRKHGSMVENALLAALPPAEMERLRPHVTLVELPHGETLWQPEEPVRHVYFPAGCLLSSITFAAPGEQVEAGMIGREGLAGLPVFFGAAADFNRLDCQVPGACLRMDARAFAAALAESSALRAAVGRYARAALGMAGQLALCNALHPVHERAARWVLMCRDGVGRDELPLTHEYLATLLGVRRASVTVVMGTLQGAGLLAYRRGHVAVADAEGLEAAACECLGIIRHRLASVTGATGATGATSTGEVTGGGWAGS